MISARLHLAAKINQIRRPHRTGLRRDRPGPSFVERTTVRNECSMACRPGPMTGTARAAHGVGLCLALGLTIATAPAAAADPLTQFLNGMFRREAPEAAPAPEPAPEAAPAPAAKPRSPRPVRP